MEEIAAYIAEDNPEAAERWVVNVFARVKTLSSFPESGREVPEIRHRKIRELVLKKEGRSLYFRNLKKGVSLYSGDVAIPRRCSTYQ